MPFATVNSEGFYMAFSKRNSNGTFSSLRDVIASTRYSEQLANIPERLAVIFSSYDDPKLEPAFRQDIFQLLSSACAVAESLSDPTYPADRANAECGMILQVLSRLNEHLSKRAGLEGFAILFPSTGYIMSQFFKSETEAHQHLESLKSMGVSSQCVVIPAKIYSHHVIQPRHRRLPPPIPATNGQSEVTVENPLPSRSQQVEDLAGKIADAYSNSGELSR